MCIVHAFDPGDPAIFHSAQAGCRECLNELLARHEGLVHHVVRKQIWGGVSEEDLLQEGRIALWRAIQRYDPGRGAAFSTYAGVAIARAVWEATEQERRVRRWVRQTDPEDAYLELEAGLWREQVHQVLVEASGFLSQSQRCVLGLVYGVGEGGVPGSEDGLGNLAAAGRRLGVTRERVRQVRNDAVAILRLPGFSVRLRQLCQQDSREAYLHSRHLSRSWLHKKGEG